MTRHRVTRLLLAGLLAAGCAGDDAPSLEEAAAEVADAPAEVEAPDHLVEQVDEPGPAAADATPADAAAAMEHLLAAIDTDDARPDQETVDHYAAVLNRADAKCRQDRDLLGDMAARSWQLVRDAGGDATVLEMLEATHEAVPAELAPMDCAEVMAGVVAVMVG